MDERTNAREKLTTTALSLMYARGYNAVGVQEICTQAGVNKGSFYYFFPSKRDLGVAVVRRYWEMLEQQIMTIAFSSDLPPLARIDRFFEMTYDRGKKASTEGIGPRGCLFGNFATELSLQEEAVRQEVATSFDQFKSYFQRTLQEAVDNGDVNQIDVEATAEALVVFYEGLSVLAKAYKSADVVDRLKIGVRQLMIPLNQ